MSVQGGPGVLGDGRLSRRRLLAVGGGLAGLAAWAQLAPGSARGAPALPDHPFTLGLASGDPLPTGVVLWTRLAPRPLAADGLGGMPRRDVVVRWEVAEDENMRKVVRRGTAVARPELAHSVHVEVDGLRPNREYWYRFAAAGEVSDVGRTKTAPARAPNHCSAGLLKLRAARRCAMNARCGKRLHGQQNAAAKAAGPGKSRRQARSTIKERMIFSCQSWTGMIHF